MAGAPAPAGDEVRDSKRGPVISESAALDEWMKRRSSLLIAERTFEQSSAAMARAMRGGGNFLWLELETGRRFAQLARTSTHVSATARRRQAARRAYDTLQRFLSGKVTLPKSELKTFREELSEFRKELEQLGEVFDA